MPQWRMQEGGIRRLDPPPQVLILLEKMGKYAIQMIFSPFLSVFEQKKKSSAAPLYGNYFNNVKKPFHFCFWPKILQHVFG